MQVFRTLSAAALIAAAGFGGIAAQAQTAQPLTRAEVQAQVAQAMKDGTLFRDSAIYTPAVAQAPVTQNQSAATK